MIFGQSKQPASMEGLADPAIFLTPVFLFNPPVLVDNVAKREQAHQADVSPTLNPSRSPTVLPG